MIGIVIVAVAVVAVVHAVRQSNQRVERWRSVNYQAHEQFLAEEPTMTEHEKSKAHLIFMISGQAAEPYSGRRFTPVPLESVK